MGCVPLDMAGYPDLQTFGLTGHQREEGGREGGTERERGWWNREEIRRKLGWTQTRKDKEGRAGGSVCLRERGALTYPDNVVIKEMKMNVGDKRQRVGNLPKCAAICCRTKEVCFDVDVQWLP